MNLKKNLRRSQAQAVIEYIVLFTILGALFMGMIWALGTETLPNYSTNRGVRGGLNLRGAFNQAISGAVEYMNN